MSLPDRGMFDAWRAAARIAISHRIAPDQIDWTGGGGLFAAAALPDAPGPHQARVSPEFIKLAGSVIWHTAPERLALLYQALWRMDIRDGSPLSQADPLGRRLHLMAKNVGRDIHKMHAFVRFRECPGDGPRRRFAAWFEPFTPRGKHRLHQAPDRSEIEHCRWWLGLELGFIQPRITLALGASAAIALTGNAAPLAARRGRLETGLHDGPVLISWHPSYILRLTDPDQQARARQELTHDLGAAFGMAQHPDPRV